MPLSAQATAIYTHLRNRVVTRRRVVTYGDVEAATGVPIGPEGGTIGRVLGEIATECDVRGLPPITAVVVNKGTESDANRHGMPGPGYFLQEALSPNNANRVGHDRFSPWSQSPAPADFDRDVSRYGLQVEIKAHQDSVWHHTAWPERL